MLHIKHMKRVFVVKIWGKIFQKFSSSSSPRPIRTERSVFPVQRFLGFGFRVNPDVWASLVMSPCRCQMFEWQLFLTWASTLIDTVRMVRKMECVAPWWLQLWVTNHWTLDDYLWTKPRLDSSGQSCYCPSGFIDKERHQCIISLQFNGRPAKVTLPSISALASSRGGKTE